MNQSKIVLIVVAAIIVLAAAGVWWWNSKGMPTNLFNLPAAAPSTSTDTGTAAQQEAKSGKGISTERVENPPVPTNVAAPGAQLPAPSAPAPIVP